jgi:transposase
MKMSFFKKESQPSIPRSSKYRELTDGERESAFAMSRQGKTNKEVAKSLGVGTLQISQMFRRQKEKRTETVLFNKNKPWTKQEVETILDMWEDHTIRDIANAVDRGMGSIQYIVGNLKKYGFKLTSKRGTPPINTAVIDALAELSLEAASNKKK